MNFNFCVPFVSLSGPHKHSLLLLLLPFTSCHYLCSVRIVAAHARNVAKVRPFELEIKLLELRYALLGDSYIKGGDVFFQLFHTRSTDNHTAHVLARGRPRER